MLNSISTAAKMKTVTSVYVAISPKCAHCGEPNREHLAICSNCGEKTPAQLTRDRKGYALGLISYTSSDPWENLGWQLGHKLKRMKDRLSWLTSSLFPTASTRPQ